MRTIAPIVMLLGVLLPSQASHAVNAELLGRLGDCGCAAQVASTSEKTARLECVAVITGPCPAGPFEAVLPGRAPENLIRAGDTWVLSFKKDGAGGWSIVGPMDHPRRSNSGVAALLRETDDPAEVVAAIRWRQRYDRAVLRPKLPEADARRSALEWVRAARSPAVVALVGGFVPIPGPNDAYMLERYAPLVAETTDSSCRTPILEHGGCAQDEVSLEADCTDEFEATAPCLWWSSVPAAASAANVCGRMLAYHHRDELGWRAVACLVDFVVRSDVGGDPGIVLSWRMHSTRDVLQAFGVVARPTAETLDDPRFEPALRALLARLGPGGLLPRTDQADENARKVREIFEQHGFVFREGQIFSDMGSAQKAP